MQSPRGLTLLFLGTVLALAQGPTLPGSAPLATQEDLSLSMVDGISRYLDRTIDEARRRRMAASPANAEDRKEFRSIIGVVDQRVAFESPILDSTVNQDAIVGRSPNFDVIAVRWPTLEGMDGEGLLLRPRRMTPVANVIAIPEADWTPEMLAGLEAGIPPSQQFARRLTELGVQVMVPVIMDRRDTYSGNPSIRMTNQPHREFIYRMSFEMGRHVIGYEVQKVLACVDWFARAFPSVPIGIAGYGEGGLLAFYSAAADERIGAALVSGYFGPREALWTEPIYRNVWNLVGRFGDAGVAGLIAPRRLIVEASRQPRIAGPPPPRPNRRGAAPGAIRTPAPAEVELEFELAKAVFPKGAAVLITTGSGDGPPGSQEAIDAFTGALGIPAGSTDAAGAPSVLQQRDGELRFQRQFNQLVEFAQAVVRKSRMERHRFWTKADSSSISRWEQTSEWYRNYLWKEVLGKLPPAAGPVQALTRKRNETALFVEWEAQIPIYPDVYAYGILLIPKNLKPGERRPVVVCQHGLEGRPSDVVGPPDGKGPYHRFAARLAEQGYITFAPQNPYLGSDRFRLLQRKANSIKLSLFSFILSQHDRVLDWLATQPYVDSKRIGFYGLSYGGKTAVRVPPILKRYALSICSGDFNDWIPKVAANDVPFSYVFTGEWEMQEWNLGNTFNYSELASLMLPRPFMVERGHKDGVGIDEWVAFEYAPVRRLYTTLGIFEKTAIEYFNGPHEIHGAGTFLFLDRHLK